MEDELEPDGLVGPHVIVITIEGVIGEWTRRYVERAIALAESKSAVLVIELETPGGLLDPTLSIVSAISKARVPVVTYGVGKWVESAGSLILVSGHVAALAPGTITGSLQPVVLDPARGYVPVNDTKIINPIIKTLCEHAASKGRNATALVKMVLVNANYGAYEALALGVVEFTAKDREELLRQINGLKVRLYDGRIVRIQAGESVEEVGLSPSETLLKVLSDPLLSGVLLSVGTLALIFSIVNSNPVGIALGVALILLGLLGYGFNPNVVAVTLVAIGAILFIAELLTPGFGLMGVIGVIMMSIGAALAPITPDFVISRAYISQLVATLVSIGVIAGLVAAFVIYKVVKAQKRRPAVGDIRGTTGIALDEITPEKEGFVLIEGEYWRARSSSRISKGEKVLVIDKEGPVLLVKPVREESRG
ncbi:MAG: nodulation protein NfeD [Acidilobaceae archaeon]